MGKEREIANSLRTLIGEAEFDTLICTVVSVDKGVSCTVKTVKSGATYTNIRLNANIGDDKGVYVVPKVGSYVLATLIDKTQGFISMFSEIDKVTFKDTSGFECVVEKGKVGVKNGSYTLKKAFDDLIDAIGRMTVTTGTGPSGVPINKAEFDLVKQNISRLLV